MTTLQKPTIYNEGITVERLNSLLNQITSRPFQTAALAAQTIRAALDLNGITLPMLEVEGGNGRTSADGPSIINHLATMSNPTKNEPPSEGEWLFKITDADGPDDDFDDHLHLYIVMDLINEDPDIGNVIDCFAQVLSTEDLDALGEFDDPTDPEYQAQKGGSFNTSTHDGDRSGESDYQKQIRHIGGLKQEK